METCNSMQGMIQRLCKKHGVDPRDPELYLHLKNPPYQPLIIEAVGKNLICLQHYVRDSWGDLHCDPDQVFLWFDGYDMNKMVERVYLIPVSLQLVMGSYHVASYISDGKITKFSQVQQRDQKSFASMWARNINHQGWVKNSTVAPKGADCASPD